MEIIGLIIAFIVPIGVAIWTVRSSATDTAKKINALEESTKKQIESIKELTRTQIEISLLQTENEIWKNKFRQLKLNKEIGDNMEREYYAYQLGPAWKNMQAGKDASKSLGYEHDFTNQMTERLTYCHSVLKKLKTELEG